MNDREQNKPLFGFLWSSNKGIPLEQTRFLRVGRRGALRILTLIPATLLLAFFSVSSLTYLATARPSVPESLLISLLVATGSVFVFRAWTLGTYVNDRGIKIVTVLRTKVLYWSVISTIDIQRSKWSALGIPLPIRSNRVLLQVPTRQCAPTHLYVGSVDGIFTSHQLETSYLLLLRWFRAE